MTITEATLRRLVVGFIMVLDTAFEAMNTDICPQGMTYIDVHEKFLPYTASADSILECLQELKRTNPDESELISFYIQYIKEKNDRISTFIDGYKKQGSC